MNIGIHRGIEDGGDDYDVTYTGRKLYLHIYLSIYLSIYLFFYLLIGIQR
jgi:hypothetical protein